MDAENIDFSAFSQDELKKVAAQAIHQIKEPEKGIGTELFEAVITIVPQTCIEAVVVDNLERPSKILVVWRDDQHYRGWHFPGGYIRFGQDFDETVRSVITRELGVPVKSFTDTEVKYSHLDSRGHTLGTIFLVELEGNPTQGQWFDHVPEELLEHHKDFLKKVLGWE